MAQNEISWEFLIFFNEIIIVGTSINTLICSSIKLAVPRNPDFSLDVERITEVVEREKPKCIFLTSPNNPDGRYCYIVFFVYFSLWLYFAPLDCTACESFSTPNPSCLSSNHLQSFQLQLSFFHFFHYFLGSWDGEND